MVTSEFKVVILYHFIQMIVSPYFDSVLPIIQPTAQRAREACAVISYKAVSLYWDHLVPL